jgi:hypothetical protein
MRIVVRGSGHWIIMNVRKGVNSGIFEVKVYVIDFFKLSKTTLPCSTPLTIEQKSSSRRSISAAFFATSLPLPIAIPISAYFIAGESLTPSPVTATIYPDF